jgi:hypothetical protein
MLRKWNKRAALVDRATAYNLDIEIPDWAKGIIVDVHLTAITDTPGITPSLRWKLGDGADYLTVATGGKLQTADTHSLIVLHNYGIYDATGLSGVVVGKMPLAAEKLNIAIAVDDTDKATYDIYTYFLE